jgi:hypothetical protein
LSFGGKYEKEEIIIKKRKKGEKGENKRKINSK